MLLSGRKPHGISERSAMQYSFLKCCLDRLCSVGNTSHSSARTENLWSVKVSDRSIYTISLFVSRKEFCLIALVLSVERKHYEVHIFITT